MKLGALITILTCLINQGEYNVHCFINDRKNGNFRNLVSTTKQDSTKVPLRALGHASVPYLQQLHAYHRNESRLFMKPAKSPSNEFVNTALLSSRAEPITEEQFFGPQILSQEQEDFSVQNVQEQLLGESSSFMPILSTALLITANTVGASMMILPDVSRNIGFGMTTELFVVIYVFNLLTSFCISEVAIQQHELSQSSGDMSSMPSSFKDFADQTLNNELLSNGIAALSVLCNMAVLAFSLMKVSDFVSIPGSNFGAPCLFSIFLIATTAVFSIEKLSGLTSICAMMLFGSFFALLVPGLLNVADPLSVITSPGLVDQQQSLNSAVSEALPLFLMTCVFQNITPTVTKILNFNRANVTIATIIGSGIPVVMYVAWCYVNLGGGLVVAGSDPTAALSSIFLEGFAIASLVGSSIACVMSIAEEFESCMSGLLLNNDSNTSEISDGAKKVLSLPSVFLSVSPPLAVGVLFANCDNGCSFTASLEKAGDYGCPLLYGLVPVLLAFEQKKKSSSGKGVDQYKTSMIPGDILTMVGVAVCSVGLVSQSVMGDVGSLVEGIQTIVAV